MNFGAGNMIGGGMMAFAMGVQQNRTRREAYRQAVIEGRRQDAQDRAMRRLAAEVRAARAEAQAARADAILGAILRSL